MVSRHLEQSQRQSLSTVRTGSKSHKFQRTLPSAPPMIIESKSTICRGRCGSMRIDQQGIRTSSLYILMNLVVAYTVPRYGVLRTIRVLYGSSPSRVQYPVTYFLDQPTYLGSRQVLIASSTQSSFDVSSSVPW